MGMLSWEDIVQINSLGPDLSAVKEYQIFGHSTEQVEFKILNVFCPKGVPASFCEELMEVVQ
jgi:hypothetical protein